jgi:hypothetical protein
MSSVNKSWRRKTCVTRFRVWNITANKTRNYIYHKSFICGSENEVCSCINCSCAVPFSSSPSALLPFNLRLAVLDQCRHLVKRTTLIQLHTSNTQPFAFSTIAFSISQDTQNLSLCSFLSYLNMSHPDCFSDF